MGLLVCVPALESRNELFGATVAASYLNVSGVPVTGGREGSHRAGYPGPCRARRAGAGPGDPTGVDRRVTTRAPAARILAVRHTTSKSSLPTARPVPPDGIVT